jgi:outer membrane protein TolC
VELKNMELAKKIYNKTLVKYKEGVSTSMDLTTAQNQYLTTQGNYFNTILQLLNANSNLNKALGN